MRDRTGLARMNISVFDENKQLRELGSGRVGPSENLDFECRVGDLVGRSVEIFEVNLAKKSSSE